jgi:DnaK suppressor protein
MEKETQDKIIKILNDQKAQILKDLKDLARPDIEETDKLGAKFPEYGDKPDENAQEISDYTTTVATEKVLEDDLKDIEGALKRIASGTYGVCKYCHKEINPKRLIARPTASSCVECKTELQND